MVPASSQPISVSGAKSPINDIKRLKGKVRFREISRSEEGMVEPFKAYLFILFPGKQGKQRVEHSEANKKKTVPIFHDTTQNEGGFW